MENWLSEIIATSRSIASRCAHSIRNRIEYFVIGTLVVTVRRIPRRWGLWFAAGVGRVAYHADRRGRRVARENLALAIRHGGLDLRGRRPAEVIRDCYANFARNFLDLFWFSGLSHEQMARWVDLEGVDKIHSESQGRGDGIRAARIHLTPHFGIFEWASLVIGCHGTHLKIVARDFRNPLLTMLFRSAREKSGHLVMSRDGVMLKLLRSLRGGQDVAMLPDLSVVPQGAATVINMFGVPASVTALHVELARRSSALLVAAVCEPLCDGRAKLRILEVFHPPLEQRRDGRSVGCPVTQRIWDLFESEIRLRPECWLWMYKHWRYRPVPQQASVMPASDETLRRVESGRDHRPVTADDLRAVPLDPYPSYAIPHAGFGRQRSVRTMHAIDGSMPSAVDAGNPRKRNSVHLLHVAHELSVERCEIGLEDPLEHLDPFSLTELS